MKKTILLLFICSLTLSCYNLKSAKEFHGKPKNVKVYTYSATDKADLIKKELMYIDSYTYDYKGNMLNWRAYKPEFPDKGLNVDYIYNGKGNLIQKNNFWLGSTTRFVTDYTYNDNNQLIKTESDRHNKKSIYKREYKNNLIISKNIVLNEDGSLFSKSIKEYNYKNQKIKVITLDKNDKTIKIYEYFYDIDGREIGINSYNKKNELVEIYEKTLNKKDDVIKSYEYKIKNNDTISLSTHNFEYKYKHDRKGNVIEKIRIMNETKFSLTVSKFTYY